MSRAPGKLAQRTKNLVGKTEEMFKNYSDHDRLSIEIWEMSLYLAFFVPSSYSAPRSP